MATRIGSLKQLVFIAFLLIISPIGFLLYKTSAVLDEQLKRSYEQTQTAIELGQQNNILERMAEDIVRTAQQYRIVQNSAILERLQDNINTYRNRLAVHKFLAETKPDHNVINDLLTIIERDPKGAELSPLPLLTYQLTNRSHAQMLAALEELQKEARATRTALWQQAALLIVATAVLMLLMTTLISRPIGQLVRRIRSVGKREPLSHKPLRGPREIVQLQDQIIWLDEHLSELESVKAEFFRHISHELKTPLTTLREGADLLAEEVPGPLNDRQHHVVSLIQNGSISLQKLIEQLLDYNRVQQVHLLSLEPVNLDAIISETTHTHQLQIIEKSLEITTPKERMSVKTDIEMLKRVLNNLISNAVCYSDTGGAITITTKRTNQMMTIDVSNTGSAIPENEVGKIFEPFFQGTRKRHGPLKGSGIGLSIALEAALALNGNLCIAENIQDKITFRFTIPLDPS